VTGYKTAQQALDAAGVQLALGLRDEEIGESVDLADLDFDQLDRAEARLLEAIAQLGRARSCRCEGGPLLLDVDGDDERCAKCGRTPA
jgi:hypothetical protein